MADIDPKDQEFIGKALALARRNASSTEGGPFGAIVVFDGKVVGEGRNQVTTSNDPTAHAEVEGALVGSRAKNSFSTRTAA